MTPFMTRFAVFLLALIMVTMFCVTFELIEEWVLS
jgi:hypothetical protein